MASGSQNLYSSPGFELFRRGLNAQSIKTFRGLNAFQAHTLLDPEWALDCLNVMVPGWGGLSKFRLPVPISQAVAPPQPAGPMQFVDFQQGTGVRQIVASFPDNSLWYFTWNAAGTLLNPGVLIERAAKDAPPWSMVEANNILFMANGIRMMKWTGTKFQAWGIAAPLLPPLFGSDGVSGYFVKVDSAPGHGFLTRAANVVTANLPIQAGLYLNIGDTITVGGGVGADASFNGSFAIATVVAPGSIYTWAQVGPGSGPTVSGYVTAPSLSIANFPILVNGATRTNGVVTLRLANNLQGLFIAGVTPQFVTVAAMADATFNGTFAVTFFDSGFVSGNPRIQYQQVGVADAVTTGGNFSLGITDNTAGRTFAYSYQNAVTGHVSNQSPAGLQLNLTNRIPLPYAALSIDPRLGTVDPQIDTIIWWATLDGGGDFFFDQSNPVTVGTGEIVPNTGVFAVNVLWDVTPDAQLDKSRQGPLINNPPPVGKYLAVGQSRIFIGNLVGAPNQIQYTGYEQILVGRPEETAPPNNRLLLQIGAEAVNGLGILQMGVVAHSATKRMYMLRGNVEDIVLNAPVAFSAFLEELPWNVGTLCHDSEQSTPYGLIFWASDRTVQLFSGSAPPSDMSATVYPILRRATVGQEANAKSCYFNWLERDWYGLTFAIDGSAVNNYAIFWALQKDGTIDIFPSDIQMDSMATISTPKSQRILAIGRQGIINNLPVSQDTAGGISDLSVIPATAGMLNAFWRSGYFGNDSPQRSKMFKRGMVVTDQDGFQVTKYLVDNRAKTIANPKILGPDAINGSTFSIGQRAARCSLLISFPPQDVASNLLELTVGSIATSDRL